MTQINPPKNDRIGNDYREGPNPNPGGEIDTGDSMIPPYDDRAKGRNERADGVERMLSGEPAPQEATQAGSSAAPRADAAMAPSGVGESAGRHAEDMIESDGKEAGRYDTGTKGQSERPTGESTSRDTSGV